MPNRNGVQTFVGQRLYTRRQLLKGLGAGAFTLSAGLLQKGCGCSPTPPKVIVVGSALKVRPKDQPTGSSDAQLLAARNEFESFQIVIQAGSQDLQDVNVTLSAAPKIPGTELVGKIPDKNITIYREDYYNVAVPSDLEGATGLWPDALIPASDPWFEEPRNAFPINVPAGENRVAWVDVLVPEDAVAGTYSGSMKVTAVDFDVTVPIELTVFNFTLPSTSNLKSAFLMSWNALCQAQYGRDCFDPPNDPATVDEGWRLNALLARIALDNRITIANPQYQPLTAQYLPLFQKHTLPLLNGTADTRLSGAKLTSFQADINKNAPPGAPLAAWRAQASQEGFLDRAFVYIAPECDEIADLPKWDKCWNNYLMKVRTGTEWPDVPILVTTTIQSETNYLNNHPGIKPFINRMVVLVTNMDGRTNPDGTPFLRFNGNQRPLYEPFRTRAQGNELWLYTSCESHGCGSTDLCQRSPTEKPTDDPGYNGWPSYAIDQPASEARAMGWMCFLYRATGELYFTTTHCLSSKTQTGEPQTAWTAQYAYGGNGDGTLFYPWDKERVGGKKWIPIESMRLKLIRDGYEDYEYLKKVVALNQEPKAFDIGKELFPPGNPARGDGMMYNTSRSSENESDSAIQTARRKLAHIIDPVNVP